MKQCAVLRMMSGIGTTLVIAILATSTAFAEFEGVLEMKTTVSGKERDQGGGHAMKIAVSKVGVRFESAVKMPGMEMKTAMISRNDTPGTIYRINEMDKTYTVMKTQKNPSENTAVEKDPIPWVVKVLGREKVLGYDTKHVLITHDTLKMEMWTAKELFDFDSFSKIQGATGAQDQGQDFRKALRDAGADGMPLKTMMHLDNGGKITTEVVKIEKKSLPASLFSIPAGYTEVQFGMPGGMGGMGRDPEAMRKRMEEMKKRMSPEQRAAMEENDGGNEERSGEDSTPSEKSDE